MRKLICLFLTFLLGMQCIGMAAAEGNPASAFTAEANAAWYQKLDFSDESEKENMTQYNFAFNIIEP